MSLLVEDGAGEPGDPNGTTGDTDNDNSGGDVRSLDLTPLGGQLRRTASRIRRYRALQAAIAATGSGDRNDGDDDDDDGASSPKICFYHPDPRYPRDAPIEEKEIIGLCLRILRASSEFASSGSSRRGGGSASRATGTKPTGKAPIPTLLQLRQKLVPSKLREHVFWESLWVLLHERKNDRGDRDFWDGVERSANKALVAIGGGGAGGQHQHHDQRMDDGRRIALLEARLRSAWDRISELTVRSHAQDEERKSLEELIGRLWVVAKPALVVPSNGTAVPTGSEPSAPAAADGVGVGGSGGPETKTTGAVVVAGEGTQQQQQQQQQQQEEQSEHQEEEQQQQRQQHTGTWEISKDSLEFLAFPPEAKEALRTEKRKRLERVHQEMAFILDSDDPKDCHGEWSCCHRTNYDDECGNPS